jgi:hypothetical protein
LAVFSQRSRLGRRWTTLLILKVAIFIQGAIAWLGSCEAANL